MTHEEAIANLNSLLMRADLTDEYGEMEDMTPYEEAVEMAIEALKERKTGRWIEKDGWDGDVYYDCSACGESWTTIEGTPWDNGMNYCPHCGAKMEGAEE